MAKLTTLLRQEVRPQWVWGSIVAAIIVASAGSLVWADKTNPSPTSDKPATASPAKSENFVSELNSLLRDESKDPRQRISEALSLLEKQKDSASKATESEESEVERLPWLDQWDEPDVGISPFGREWDPWREMQNMRARIDRMFSNTWRRMNEQTHQLKSFAARFSPMGEFEQTNDAYIYRFDLPGVAKEDVKVTVENGRLTIEGKRESRVDENRKGLARREIFYGHFRRDVLLPPDADHNNAKTKLENGVLTIEIPRLKQAGSSKRELKIQ